MPTDAPYWILAHFGKVTISTGDPPGNMTQDPPQNEFDAVERISATMPWLGFPADSSPDAPVRIGAPVHEIQGKDRAERVCRALNEKCEEAEWSGDTIFSCVDVSDLPEEERIRQRVNMAKLRDSAEGKTPAEHKLEPLWAFLVKCHKEAVAVGAAVAGSERDQGEQPTAGQPSSNGEPGGSGPRTATKGQPWADEAPGAQRETIADGSGDEQRKRPSLEDWLWRLDRIQQDMERLIPTGNLYVLFTLKVDSLVHSNQELETLPFGRTLSMADRPAAKYNDPDTGALWFDLGHQGLPFVVCWDNVEGLSVHDSMPSGFYPNDNDGPFPCETLGWCRWYYLKGNDHGKAADRERIASRIIELEEAALEACDLAPLAVLRKVGNLSAMGCWPTALFYLAMKGLHPLIRPFGGDVSKHGHGEGKPKAWYRYNDHFIMLSPDLCAATRHAFDLFRQSTQDTSKAPDAAGPAGMRAEEAPSSAEPAGIKRSDTRAASTQQDSRTLADVFLDCVGALYIYSTDPDLPDSKDVPPMTREERQSQEKTWEHIHAIGRQLAVEAESLGIDSSILHRFLLDNAIDGTDGMRIYRDVVTFAERVRTCQRVKMLKDERAGDVPQADAKEQPWADDTPGAERETIPDAAGRAGMPAEETPSTSEPAGAEAAQDTALPERAKVAYAQYGRAEQECSSKDGRAPTDQQCYDWLKNHNDDDSLPAFGTWQRYLRKAREHHGKQKNTPRAGREHGRSVVPAKDIEPLHTDEPD